MFSSWKLPHGNFYYLGMAQRDAAEIQILKMVIQSLKSQRNISETVVFPFKTF